MRTSWAWCAAVVIPPSPLFLVSQVHLCSQPLRERVPEWDGVVCVPGLARLAAQPVWQAHWAGWHHLPQSVTRGAVLGGGFCYHIQTWAHKLNCFHCVYRNVYRGYTWEAERKSRTSPWSIWRSSTLSTRAGCSTRPWRKWTHAAHRCLWLVCATNCKHFPEDNMHVLEKGQLRD